MLVFVVCMCVHVFECVCLLVCVWSSICPPAGYCFSLVGPASHSEGDRSSQSLCVLECVLVCVCVSAGDRSSQVLSAITESSCAPRHVRVCSVKAPNKNKPKRLLLGSVSRWNDVGWKSVFAKCPWKNLGANCAAFLEADFCRI